LIAEYKGYKKRLPDPAASFLKNYFLQVILI